MRKIGSMALAGTLALSAAGCYHATVETGRAPSGQTVEREWAHSFLYGLVPPSEVETAAECPNGVARVDTQLSFLNQVATVVTAGLYTPMTITVQCAAAGTALVEGARVITLPAAAGRSDLAGALGAAAQASADADAPVYVRFETMK